MVVLNSPTPPPRGSWPEALPPKKGLKFAVVDPMTGNRSSTWRASTSKTKNDVFLQEVSTGPLWKVSHHNGCSLWQIGMTKDGAHRLGVRRQFIDQWASDQPEEGWSEGVGVLVPCAYLRPESEPLAANVTEIPTLPGYSALAIKLIFEEAGAPGRCLGHAFPVGVLLRPTGGRVYLLAEAVSLSPSAHEALAYLRQHARTERLADTDRPTAERFVGALSLGQQRVLVDLTTD